MKFSDLLIASTSLSHDEVCFWEPKTLAPYDPLIDKKFYCQANTLQVNSASYVIGANATKTTVNVWRWDKKEAMLRFPVKEMLSCLRLTHNAGTLCLAGSKTGRLSVWEFSTGELLGEIESCHYLEVSDMDIAVTNDLVITGGKDFKVRVWVITDLYFGQKNAPLVEFSEHTSDVTAVQFSKSSP
jgi:WD40 repeat protein